MDRLPDDCIVQILQSLESVRDIAECAQVCKRWNNLRWQVRRLHFECPYSDTEDVVRTDEHIFDYLLEMRRQGGRLRELQVRRKPEGFLSDTYALIFPADWLLLCSETVEKLDLNAADVFVWGCQIWRYISAFINLKELKIRGLIEKPPRSFRGFSLKSLTALNLESVSEGGTITGEALEFTMRECTSLRSVYAVMDELSTTTRTLSVRHPSLESVHIRRVANAVGCFTLILETPKLRKLWVAQITIVRLLGEQHLEYFFSCGDIELKGELDDIVTLHLSAIWNFHVLMPLFGVASRIEELRLWTFISGEHPISFADLLGSLKRLKKLVLAGNVLEGFLSEVNDREVSVLQEHRPFEMRVQITNDPLSVELLQNVLSVCSALENLIIDPDEVAAEEQKGLFDLYFSFPGRVKLQSMTDDWWRDV